MSRLPREARDGLMRVFIQLLHEKHPGVAWVSVQGETEEQSPVDETIPAAELVHGPRVDLANAG